MQKRVGEVFRRARIDAGLSLRDVAAITGMSDGQISQIEGGVRSDPKFSTIARLAGAIGISLDRLAAECGYSGIETPRMSVEPSARERAALLRNLESAKAAAESLVERIDKAVDTARGTPPKQKSSRSR